MEQPETISSTHQGAMDQKSIIEEMSMLCLKKINKTKRPEGHCEVSWDGLYCWPSVPAATVHSIPCPPYIYGFNSQAFATRYCTNIGIWFKKEGENVTWTNYTLCMEQVDTVLTKSLIEPHMDNIKLISTIGYSLSLSTLLVAFLILAFVRRLRCPRNNLHMHLFISFIMRSTMCLLKDILFYENINWNINSTLSEAMNHHLNSNVDCKVFTSFWHYFLMANYCWILMEGVYLHNLVFLALFTDTSSIFRYLLAGWGLPVLFIVPWVVMRAIFDDTLCWTTNENSQYFWIIRGPITASILVNFVLFINITRVLFVKMFDSKNSYAKQYRYRKWFKSTLVLVPLFGVHYAIFLAMSLAAEVNMKIEVVWLYIDQLFSSSQGSFVALLYCFLNGEVQSEVKKIWQAKVTSKESRFRRSLLNQSLTSYVSRGRNSVQSFHSTTANEKKSTVQVVSPMISEQGKTQDSISKEISHIECNPFDAEDVHSSDEHLISDAGQIVCYSEKEEVKTCISPTNKFTSKEGEDCLLISGPENEQKETNL